MADSNNPYAGLTDEQLDALIASGQPVAVPPNKTYSEMTGLGRAGGAGIVGGLADVGGTLGDIQSLGNAAIDKWGPPGTNVGNVIAALKKSPSPGGIGYVGFPNSQDTRKAIETVTGPPYQPQTPAEKMMYAGGEALPYGLLGGEAAPLKVLSNVARAGLSGAASEGAGQATQGTGLETPARVAAGLGTYGATGAPFRFAISPNSVRSGAAQTLENSGMLGVRASDITGSRVKATLEGGRSPADLDDALTSTLQQQGGVPRMPGDNRPYRELLNDRQTQLGGVANQLGAQTSIPATAVPAVRQQLNAVVQQHARDFAGAEHPEVAQALDRFDTHLTENSLQGRPGLTGQQYQRLHQEWGASPIPEVRAMSGVLDQAMDTAHPGAWPQWRQGYGDLQGLRAAHAARDGDLAPMDPKQILQNQYAVTPMYRTAEAAKTIQGKIPQPYDVGALGHVGAMLAGGLGGTGIPGIVPGSAEHMIAGTIYPEVAAQGVKALARPLASVFQSGPGQNVLRNMDPKMVAALLAQQGISRKTAPGEQPSQQVQGQ